VAARDPGVLVVRGELVEEIDAREFVECQRDDLVGQLAVRRDLLWRTGAVAGTPDLRGDVIQRVGELVAPNRIPAVLRRSPRRSIPPRGHALFHLNPSRFVWMITATGAVRLATYHPNANAQNRPRQLLQGIATSM
jgi:hypothetical protein